MTSAAPTVAPVVDLRTGRTVGRPLVFPAMLNPPRTNTVAGPRYGEITRAYLPAR